MNTIAVGKSLRMLRRDRGTERRTLYRLGVHILDVHCDYTGFRC